MKLLSFLSVPKRIVYLTLLFLILEPIQAVATDRTFIKDWWGQIATINQLNCKDSLSALKDGTLAHRKKTSQFTVDEYTWKDLNGESLIFPLLAQHSPSLLGQLRIANMLKNTSTDPAEIRLRQEAIQELQNDSDLRFDIQSLFQHIASSIEEQSMISVIGAERELKSSIAIEVVGAFITHLAWLTPLSIYFLGDVRTAWSSLGVGLTFAMSGQRGGDQIREIRVRHTEIKRLIKVTQRIYARLKDVKSPLLRELLEVFGKFDSRNYDSPSNRAVRSYMRVQEGVFSANFLNYSFLSSITMRMMNQTLSQNRNALVRLGTAMSELAALSAIAEYAQQPGLTYPKILPSDEPTQMRITKGHHPYVLTDLQERSVPNDVWLSADPKSDQQFILLTGINTGGKSTVLRMLATNILIGQIGAPIPAEYAEWTPMAVISNMNVNDSISERSSFFRAQVNRVNQIFLEMNAQKHALILMDEIFTGTSPEEHRIAEEAVIQHLLNKPHIAILATHDRSLAQLQKRFPRFKNYHVGDTDEPKYVLFPGVSQTRNAKSVMREVGMPDDFLSLIVENPSTSDESK